MQRPPRDRECLLSCSGGIGSRPLAITKSGSASRVKFNRLPLSDRIIDGGIQCKLCDNAHARPIKSPVAAPARRRRMDGRRSRKIQRRGIMPVSISWFNTITSFAVRVTHAIAHDFARALASSGAVVAAVRIRSDHPLHGFLMECCP